MPVSMNHPAPPASQIGQRLKEEMKRRGVSSAWLASAAGVKTSFIYDILSGKSANPSTVKLARVADSLGVSLRFLVDTVESAPAAVPLTTGSDFLLVPRLMVDTARQETAVVSLHQEDAPFCFRRSWIRHTLGADPDSLRLMRVEGDSMAPTLCAGDALLVDTAAVQASPPGIFVLYDGYGLTPRRLELLAHLPHPRIRVISDNPQYTVYDRSPEDIRIMGRVVWFARGT